MRRGLLSGRMRRLLADTAQASVGVWREERRSVEQIVVLATPKCMVNLPYMYALCSQFVPPRPTACI